mgnify:CR=1 FL=1
MYACHKRNAVNILDGHHKWSDGTGFLSVSTEEYSTASWSTLTDCDMYVAFLTNEYDMIAEAAAKGEGPHLVTLAEFNGCSKTSLSEFNLTLQNGHNELFYQASDINFELFQVDLNHLIKSNQTLSQECTG